MQGKNIFLISGWATAGKDHLAEHLVKNHNFIKFAFADELKKFTSSKYGFDIELTQSQEGKKCIINGNKNSFGTGPPFSCSVRDLLIEEGSSKRNSDPNFWCQNIVEKISFMEKINDLKNTVSGGSTGITATQVAPLNIVISDWRYHKEFNVISKVFKENFNITTIRVKKRNLDESPVDSSSETQLDNFDFDFIIQNNGDYTFNDNIDSLVNYIKIRDVI